jgi:hypothetical protein
VRKVILEFYNIIPSLSPFFMSLCSPISHSFFLFYLLLYPLLFSPTHINTQEGERASEIERGREQDRERKSYRLRERGVVGRGKKGRRRRRRKEKVMKFKWVSVTGTYDVKSLIFFCNFHYTYGNESYKL